MADIRGVYGRQAEAHQFPIQFAALALPILGTRLLREGGSSLPPERWHCLLDESFPRLNIEDPVTPPPFDRVCYGEKKREGGIPEKRQESSRFHIQETLYSAGISGNVLYIPG